MKKKIPLNYRTLQKIKAEEYEKFFSGRPDYYPYMNHLGEIRWMTEEEALDQHEYFSYGQSTLERWKKRIKLKRRINFDKISEAEREFRLKCRMHLEKQYLGKIQPETEALLPSAWKFEIEDENVESIPISSDIGLEGVWKKVLFTMGIFAAIALVSYVWVTQSENSPNGKLMVTSNVVGARIFLDDVDFIGYSNKMIKNLPTGLHRVSAFKEGYSAFPKFQDTEIVKDSLLTLHFSFRPASSDVQGFLKIIAEQPDSKIFVDSQYFGTVRQAPVVALNEGQHFVKIAKDGFMSSPSEKVVNISQGDTSIFIVQQITLAKTKTSPFEISGRNTIGNIEVTSDVKNARIFLNGKDSGHKTDYVFTQMPFRNYLIQVQKEGYSVSPREETISLNAKNPGATARFRLKKEFEKVSIQTTPANGSIFIDNEFRGEGTFEGVLKVGKHLLSFGDLNQYKKPKSRQIEIKPGFPFHLKIAYFPQIRLLAEVDSRGNVKVSNCELFSGYNYSGRAFTASTEGGPSVEFNKKLKEYVWKLGYAFAYRNPKGNDALKLVFALPSNLNYEQTFTLRLLAIASREKYPLSLSAKIGISIKLNSTRLDRYYKPKFLEDLNGLETVEFDVTSAISPRENILEISTKDQNNTYFYIKRIEIFN